jgi:hypothetical protein
VESEAAPSHLGRFRTNRAVASNLGGPPQESNSWRLREVGRDEAIRDLAQISFSFCLINRVAGALGFKVMGREQFARGWPTMRDRGYIV